MRLCTYMYDLTIFSRVYRGGRIISGGKEPIEKKKGLWPRAQKKGCQAFRVGLKATGHRTTPDHPPPHSISRRNKRTYLPPAKSALGTQSNNKDAAPRLPQRPD